MNKTCSYCKESKPLDQYRKYSFSKDGLGIYCKLCLRLKYESYLERKKPERNKAIAKNVRAIRIRNSRMIYEYLLNHPCIDCGEKDPIVLEFDHRDSKLGNVVELVGRGWSKDKIMKEIGKCDVRCANCHRRKTALAGNYLRATFKPC